MTNVVSEQVPRYSLSYTDDGTQERLQLTVQLPGLASAKEFQVTVKSDLFTLHAEGRYKLNLPLNPPVDEKPELLRFVKKKAVLKAELKVLSASQSLSRASSSPLIERRHAHSSDLSPDLDSSPDRELSRTRHSNDDGGLASTAGTPDHHQQPGSLYDSDVSTPAFVQAELNEQTQALHGIWQQLIAQQRLNGALGENMSQGPASDTQSTGSSHGLTTGSHQEAPVTPSVPLPSTSYGNTNTHLTFDYGTEMLNPLWNPDSAAESVGSRTIPQASASPSSGWQTVSDADIDGTQHTANGFGDAQPSEPPASSEEQASSSSQDAEEHMSEASSAHNPANGLDAGQPQQQAASTDTGTADLYPQTAGRDIYAEAQTQLNKDAAEAFFVKGKEAVQKRDWPRAGRLLTKACSLDQGIHQRLASMIGKLDQKFVPSLVSYLPSDLLNPDNDAEPVAATSSPTPRSKHQVQNGGAAGTAAAAVDTAAAAAGTAAPASQAAAAAAGPQAAEAAAAAQTASAPANADAPSEAGHSNAERPSFHAGRYGSSQRKTGQQHKSGQDAVGSRKRRRSGAPLRSSQHSHVQCKQGATASHAEQQSATASHAGQQSATASQAEQQSATASRAGQQSATASHADLQGATASHAEHQDATANHRDQQGAISNPADRHGATASQSEQQEATASHAEVPQSEGNPESSWTGHRHSRPYDSGTAPDLDTSNGGSNQSDTDWQPWKDGYEDGSTRSEPPGRPGLQSSMHDLLIRLQIFIMACWRSGRSCCKTEAARICSFLASDTKVAAVYLKHGTLLCLAVMTAGGSTAWSWAKPAAGPLLQALAWSVQPCLFGARRILKLVLLCLAVALTLLVIVYDYLQAYILLLMWIAGKRKWIQSTLDAKNRGEWQARLLLWVISPLLAFTTVWWFVANPMNLGLLSAAGSCIKWPFVQGLGFAYATFKYVTSTWLLVPLCLALRLLSTTHSHKAWCSDIILWWALGGGLGGYAALLVRRIPSGAAAARETWTTHIAVWLSWQLWTTSYLRDWTLFRLAVIAGTWYAWMARDDLVEFLKQPADQPTPQAASAGKEVPMSRPTGDAKEEIKRILAAKSHYAVLEVDSSAKEDTIKRARRMKSLVVHPDKVGPDVIGANEAFMKVTQAAEILSDAAQRRQYDSELAANGRGAARPSTSSQTQDTEANDANMFYQPCSDCGELHRMVRRPDMDYSNARWCREHMCHHPVKKGEGWVTVKYFGLFNLTTEYVVYACLQPDGEIFDVTELATCQGMLRSQAFRLQGADCCKVWLTFNPQQTQREKQQHRQQDRHARQQEHQARQEQSARDKANRKQGRKGRKRR